MTWALLADARNVQAPSRQLPTYWLPGAPRRSHGRRPAPRPDARKNSPPARVSRARLRLGLSAGRAGIIRATTSFQGWWRIGASADRDACGPLFGTGAARWPHRAGRLPWLRRAADATAGQRRRGTSDLERREGEAGKSGLEAWPRALSDRAGSCLGSRARKPTLWSVACRVVRAANRYQGSAAAVESP